MASTTEEQRTHMESGKSYLHGDVWLPPGGLTLICSKASSLERTIIDQGIVIVIERGLTPHQDTLAKTDIILNRH